jgi:gliding motility-associated-like protein
VITWFYNFGDGNYSTDSAMVHEYATYGNYLITQYVTNEWGCADTAWVEVQVLPDFLVYVPNSFTPDGDGLNDGFKPIYDGFVPTLYEFSVWNRWGEAIFFTNDPEEAWTGNVRDGTLFTPDGVYNWVLKIRAHHDVTIHLLEGHVTVVR